MRGALPWANPLFVAIDHADPAAAHALAQAVAPHVGGLKLGLEFFCANGPDGVRRLADIGLPIFLDLKLHDIPNTVARALEAVAPLAPAIVNVHAGGGPAMLAAARTAVAPPTRLVAVTVLTSLDDADLVHMGVEGAGGAQAHARRLGGLARAAGLDGVVCSAHEIAGLRADWPDALLVVPGLRAGEEAEGDQKRVQSPAAALAAGADVLVVGRPITKARDPAAAAAMIRAAL